MAEIIQILILGLALGGVIALMGSGLSLVFGVMHIVNLAHPALIVAGAYVAFLGFRYLGIDPILMMIPSAIIMALVGVVIYKLIFEKEARSAKYRK